METISTKYEPTNMELVGIVKGSATHYWLEKDAKYNYVRQECSWFIRIGKIYFNIIWYWLFKGSWEMVLRCHYFIILGNNNYEIK